VACLVGLCAAATAARAQSPGAAKLLLEPRYFAVWQAWDVAFPFVVDDAQDGRQLLYYTGGGVDSLSAAAWDFQSIGVAVSTNGQPFQDRDDYAPIVRPGPYREGQPIDAELRAARFDSVWAFGAAVVRGPDAFRMWYTGWAGEQQADADGVLAPVGFRIGLATSADGLRFVKQPGAAGAQAVLAPGPEADDSGGVGQPAVIVAEDGLRMYYEGFDGRSWRIVLATSSDGLGWTKRGIVLDTGAAGALDELGLRNPVVIRRRGRFELWYQGRSRSQPAFHVLRATSEDGRRWHKVGEEVRLHPEAAVSDDEQIHVDSVLVSPDGSCQAFFAKQTLLDVSLGEDLGVVRRKTFRIYGETVDP
jgi:predicted GH43/DUF377 family glycosyl hydrolase